MTVRIFIAAVLVTVAFQPLADLAQVRDSPNANRLTAVAALEQTLVEAIARAEQSVVAVARATPQASRRGPLPFDGEDLFANLRPADGEESSPPVVAAGVIIDNAGLVLTEYLAVQEGDEHTITTIDGQTFPASVRAADPRSGLAVLAIKPRARPLPRSGTATIEGPASFPAIPFGDAAKLRKGQFVISIGNPFGVVTDGQPTASWGTVTNLARKAPPGANLNNAPGPFNDFRTTLHHLGTLIQTDAKLGWSAGGGALVNLQGELVGITTTVATIAGHEQPAGYAIPINSTMRRIITVLTEGREVEYGLLGISFDTRSRPTAEPNGRVAVGQVFSGSPAARAGLQTGDVITRVNDRPIDDSDSLQLAVSALPPSATASIEYRRGAEVSTAAVKLTKLAVAGRTIATAEPQRWRGIRVDYATALGPEEFLAAIASGAYDAEGCVLVVDVEPGSPAAVAGIRRGMFISHVSDWRVTTPDEFRAAARNVGPGLDIRLTQPAQARPSAPEAEIPNRPPNDR